jgi:hypothetical protein
VSVGQILTLISGGNGPGNPVGSPVQWFGGKAKAFAWNSISSSAIIEVSPDGGTTWIKVLTIANDGVLVSQSAPLAFSADFSEPAMLVRASGSSTSSSQNLNVVLIGTE